MGIASGRPGTRAVLLFLAGLFVALVYAVPRPVNFKMSRQERIVPHKVANSLALSDKFTLNAAYEYAKRHSPRSYHLSLSVRMKKLSFFANTPSTPDSRAIGSCSAIGFVLNQETGGHDHSRRPPPT